MKIALNVFLAFFLAFLVGQIWVFWQRSAAARDEYAATRAELAEVRAAQNKSETDYGYLQNPANLEKELRGKFNYRGAEEKLIIIVPSATTTP